VTSVKELAAKLSTMFKSAAGRGIDDFGVGAKYGDPPKKHTGKCTAFFGMTEIPQTSQSSEDTCGASCKGYAEKEGYMKGFCCEYKAKNGKCSIAAGARRHAAASCRHHSLTPLCCHRQ